MKTIALLGAPGSGKTKLAEAIADEYIRSDGQCDECNTPVHIVDEYAQYIRDHGQYEIGIHGGYMANISIAVERYNRERHAFYEIKPKTLIICGTVIETSVYLSGNFERMFKLANSDEDKIQTAQRIEGTSKMLATLYMDTFQYTKAFYLPAHKPPTEENWMTFERNLQAAFNAFNAPVAPLLIEDATDEDDLLEKQVAKVMGRE